MSTLHPLRDASAAFESPKVLGCTLSEANCVDDTSPAVVVAVAPTESAEHSREMDAKENQGNSESSHGANDSVTLMNLDIGNALSNSDVPLFTASDRTIDDMLRCNDSGIDIEANDCINGVSKNELHRTMPISPSYVIDSSSSQMSSIQSNSSRPPRASASPDQSSLFSRGLSLLGRTMHHAKSIKTVHVGSDASNTKLSNSLSHDFKPAASPDPKAPNVLSDDCLRRHLVESGLFLFKRLIEFLSECPPAPDEDPNSTGEVAPSETTRRGTSKGLTIPASAIGWLSSQIDPGSLDVSGSCDDESEETECYRVPGHQLQCLEGLLRRVTSLRITGDTWPPSLVPSVSEVADGEKKTFSIPEAGIISSKLLSKFGLDPTLIDDESCTEGSSPKEIAVSAFRNYFHHLQFNPNVNMSLFPYASKIIFDGIPPNWITHMDALRSLEMFQMERCCIRDVNALFFSSDFNPDTLAGEDGVQQFKTTIESELYVFSSLAKLRLSNCAIGEAAGLRGRRISAAPHNTPRIDPRDEIPHPDRIPFLSRFPNLVSLNLSRNELFRTRTALAGLSSLPLLSHIDLSHNRLSRMNDIFRHIGNVKELILSGNEISSTQGLDRLFSLERLSLDDNKLQHLSNISGLAKLPFLMNFDLRGNPLEVVDPAMCRIDVLNLFREVRCKSMPKNATYRDMQRLLPILDNELATKDELVAIKGLTFRQAVVPLDSFVDPDSDASGMDGTTEIFSKALDYSKGRRRVTKISPSRTVHYRIDVSDDADDLVIRRIKSFHDRIDKLMNEVVIDEVPVQFNIEEIITSICPRIDLSVSDQSLTNDNQTRQRSRTFSSFSQGKIENPDSKHSEFPFPFLPPASLLVEADDDVWNSVPICETLPDYNGSDQIDDVLLENDMACPAHEKNDTAHSPQYNGQELSLIDLIKETSDSYYSDLRETVKCDESQEAVIELEQSKSLFEGIWEQAYRDNITSSSSPLDANHPTPKTRSRSIDFNLEELNAAYDGPEDYRSIFVSSDLDLYFDSYVFPQGSDNDDSQDEVLKSDEILSTPRIQLFQFDRNAMRLEQRGCIERYVGVWREDVLACGSFARNRLQPIEIPKRGFHGETFSNLGKSVLVCESRKVIVCISSAALYLIIDDDVAPKQKKAHNAKRPFPSRMPPSSTIGDANWPHALIRHSLKCLVGITIGFQFQRLTLRFSVSNGMGSTFEYTYIILTSNKLRTISLLQKIQSHVSDVQMMNSGDRNAILIENDDKAFLDALGARPDEVVLHYQILHQVWKRGDREAARRAFVLTDSTIYLLNESYNGNGSETQDPKRLGEVSLAIIDSSRLRSVTEVRAANEDPRMITLVILSLNKLKRSHRWRLVCNDGDGAERLIDDVRKAVKCVY